MDPNCLNFNELSNGEAAARLNMELQKVFNNIHDMNTDPNKKRKIVMEIEFEPDESRVMSSVGFRIKSILAPQKMVKTTFIIDRNLQGAIIGQEYKKQVPGQIVMSVEKETGEVSTGKALRVVSSNNE